VKRLLTLALILGLSLHLWLYNEVIVDTFFDAPTTLAGALLLRAIQAHRPLTRSVWRSDHVRR